MNTSFPVHPTQLYESLVGLALLGLLLWQRKHMRFRGQVFFLFVFAYGFLRFLLELWRDDVERGSYGPTLDAHVFIPLCLLLWSLGLRLRHLARASRSQGARTVARVLAFVPAVVAYVSLTAGELRADGALPALDQPAHRPAERADRGLLLCALLGRGGQDIRALAMSLGDLDVPRRASGRAEADKSKGRIAKSADEDERARRRCRHGWQASARRRGLTTRSERVTEPARRSSPWRRAVRRANSAIGSLACSSRETW